MITIYGIKNCQSIKKAFDKFQSLGLNYEFFDYKKQPPSKAMLTDWVHHAGLDKILNKKGLTWRTISHEDKQKAMTDTDFALALMIDKPSLIKRPIISLDDGKHKQLIVGLDEQQMDLLQSQ